MKKSITTYLSAQGLPDDALEKFLGAEPDRALALFIEAMALGLDIPKMLAGLQILQHLVDPASADGTSLEEQTRSLHGVALSRECAKVDMTAIELEPAVHLGQFRRVASSRNKLYVESLKKELEAYLSR